MRFGAGIDMVSMDHPNLIPFRMPFGGHAPGQRMTRARMLRSPRVQAVVTSR